MNNIPKWAVPMIEEYQAHQEAERKQFEAELEAQIAARASAMQNAFSQIYDRMEACGVAWEYEREYPSATMLAAQGFSEETPKGLLELLNVVIEISKVWGIAPVRYVLAFNHARADVRAWLDARHYVEFSYYYWPQTGYKHPSAYATLSGHDEDQAICKVIQPDPLTELVKPEMRMEFVAAVARMMGKDKS